MGVIPFFSALTRLRRKVTRPLLRELNRPRLKHPTNMDFGRHLCHWRFMDFEQHLRHWRSMGRSPLYKSGIDTSILQATSSAFLRSTTAAAESAAALRQAIKADEYRGKYLRFSGDVKVERVEQQAGLWVEAIIPPHRRGERLKPENVVQGTYGWMRYEETIPIPEDAHFIRFGVILHGQGQIWLANARLEVIEQDAMLSA
jgi:hypothetical protein